MPDLTHERLRELLHYDPETGDLIWRVARGRIKAGTIASSKSHGYVQVMIDYRNYKGHRLAWFWVHGEWPAAEIDHRDGRPADNRFSELRSATSSQNKMNRRIGSNNTSGLKGAFLDKRDGRWYSRITINRKHTHLGRFETAQEAHAAYVSASREAYGEFACPTR